MQDFIELTELGKNTTIFIRIDSIDWITEQSKGTEIRVSGIGIGVEESIAYVCKLIEKAEHPQEE